MSNPSKLIGWIRVIFSVAASISSGWPSGLRRHFQVVVLIGVGSNPTSDMSFALHNLFRFTKSKASNKSSLNGRSTFLADGHRSKELTIFCLLITLLIMALNGREARSKDRRIIFGLTDRVGGLDDRDCRTTKG
jgi:hypothetical protein